MNPIKPLPNNLRRSPGYVLITVLVLLTLVTTLIAMVQATARRALTDLPVEAALTERQSSTADLIALAPSLKDTSDPVLVEADGPWIKVVLVDGLIDLNLAPESVILAVLATSGLATRDPAERLSSLRADGTRFTKVTDGLAALGLSETEKVSITGFFTVFGSASVRPDAVPNDIRSAVTRALADSGTAPLTGPTSPNILVLTAPERDGSYVPRLYMRSTSDPNRPGMRLQSIVK
ncbi:MAG: hypothetical protein AAF718_07680 [Pseudomonadota bacterium]